MKIIGNGFIAKNFSKIKLNNDIILFASGVSNSKCKSKNEYKRELNKAKYIFCKYPKSKFIYFSSCSILDKSRNKNYYQRHKIKMEKYIKDNFNDYLIFRLPELIGKNKNKKTLINNFIEKIKSNKSIDTSKEAYRNIIDIKTAIFVIKYIIENNYNKRIFNIANTKMYSTLKILETLQKIYKKKAKIIFNNKYNNKNKFKINLNYTNSIYKKLNVKFGKNYLYNKIKINM